MELLWNISVYFLSNAVFYFLGTFPVSAQKIFKMAIVLFYGNFFPSDGIRSSVSTCPVPTGFLSVIFIFPVDLFLFAFRLSEKEKGSITKTSIADFCYMDACFTAFDAGGVSEAVSISSQR